jgi:hypothetical protein
MDAIVRTNGPRTPYEESAFIRRVDEQKRNGQSLAVAGGKPAISALFSPDIRRGIAQMVERSTQKYCVGRRIYFEILDWELVS